MGVCFAALLLWGSAAIGGAPGDSAGVLQTHRGEFVRSAVAACLEKQTAEIAAANVTMSSTALRYYCECTAHRVTDFLSEKELMRMRDRGHANERDTYYGGIVGNYCREAMIKRFTPDR